MKVSGFVRDSRAHIFPAGVVYGSLVRCAHWQQTIEPSELDSRAKQPKGQRDSSSHRSCCCCLSLHRRPIKCVYTKHRDEEWGIKDQGFVVQQHIKRAVIIPTVLFYPPRMQSDGEYPNIFNDNHQILEKLKSNSNTYL